jgi:hypothetical protein
MGGGGRRRKQPLDDLEGKRRYFKEAALARSLSYGPVARQTIK